MRLMPRSRRGALGRSLAAVVVVVACTASATAVAGLLQFKQAVEELDLRPAIPHARIRIADPGSPQTLLLIGSDHRAGTPWTSSNTDTMMLVRLDPNSQTINLLSIPRDLKVLLPQGGVPGTEKLNAAYSLGGPNLLLKTLRQQVFPGLQVNHIVDVNFGGFEAVVNAIGCVYTDVDHRYYNNTAATNYSSIDIQPGYQKLCGPDALAFVRFRHTDNDLVRNARQQDFLRWVKSQFSASDLLSEKDRLLSIFGQHAQTDSDLHHVDGLINLFNLVVFSAGHTIKQVPFPALFLPCDPACYVGATPGAEARAYRLFMTPTRAPAGGAAHPGARPAARPGPPPSPAKIGLTADTTDGAAQAATLGKAGMQVFYPRLIDGQSQYCTDNGNCPVGPVADSYPRSYAIRDQSGAPHAAYRMTLVINPVFGQYYAVQGTTWLTPPILRSPTKTQVVGGRLLDLYFNGGKLSLVAWHHGGAVYWISNTLTSDLTPNQMVEIAASLTPAR
jgi:polyisoprenyl-teichoic acid--peptidoglycan teichoic acid transferase